MHTQPGVDESRRGPIAFGLLAIVLVLLFVGMIAGKEWLKTTIGAPIFTLIAAAATILMMTGATYLSARSRRGLDEVQKAGLSFAAQWAIPAGQMAFVLLLFLPPVKDLATAVVTEFVGDPGVTVDQSAVVLAMTIGFMGVTLLQALATMVFSLIWWRSKE